MANTYYLVLYLKLGYSFLNQFLISQKGDLNLLKINKGLIGSKENIRVFNGDLPHSIQDSAHCQSILSFSFHLKVK